jgi:hypothetical protein
LLIVIVVDVVSIGDCFDGDDAVGVGDDDGDSLNWPVLPVLALLVTRLLLIVIALLLLLLVLF